MLRSKKEDCNDNSLSQKPKFCLSWQVWQWFWSKDLWRLVYQRNITTFSKKNWNRKIFPSSSLSLSLSNSSLSLSFPLSLSNSSLSIQFDLIKSQIKSLFKGKFILNFKVLKKVSRYWETSRRFRSELEKLPIHN